MIKDLLNKAFLENRLLEEINSLAGKHTRQEIYKPLLDVLEENEDHPRYDDIIDACDLVFGNCNPKLKIKCLDDK